ncbi:MAG: radical SAM family heme chaperone HemW [Solobacterium sp.]|nr:radical SAM family heme chaperone HemW [Solobacterium sp.]
MMTTNVNRPRSLYVHVPFCRSICFYCDFCHTVYDPKRADRWLQALQEELAHDGIHPGLRTLYIGGGTPGCLDAERLDSLLSLFDDSVRTAEEYTVEINPETFDSRKAKILVSHGVSRLSIGMQSSDEKLLKLMGRHHTFADVSACMNTAREAGIGNFSLDLMYSLPGQTMASFVRSIHDAVSLRPDHLSLYSLTVEDNTVFGRRGYRPLDEETEADMYETAVRLLEEAGYHQYEVSSFAFEHKEAVHNLVYWHYEDFQGLGCGASGKEKGVRYDHSCSLAAYLQDPLYKETTKLTREDQAFEMVMMNLRLKEGLDLRRFETAFGCPLSAFFGEKLKRQMDLGMLESKGGFLRCTAAGYPIMNTILSELL